MPRFVKIGLVALAALAGLIAGQRESLAQPAIDPRALAEIQGRWISRFENDDAEIEIRGREVRVIRAKQVTYAPGTPAHLRYQPQPGDLVAIVESAVVSRMWPSQFKGQPDRPSYAFRFRCMSNHGNAYRMTDKADCSGNLVPNTHSVPAPGGSWRPLFDYQTLEIPGMPGSSSFWKPDIKQRIFGGDVTAGTSPAQGQSARPATRPAPPQSAARQQARPPEPPVTIPVTSEQERAELATRERLNREQADFAARQLAENAAAKKAFEQATADREATIARQQAEYAAKVAAAEAEQQRRERAYAEAMEKWRADVAACKAGHVSRCGQPQP